MSAYRSIKYLAYAVCLLGYPVLSDSIMAQMRRYAATTFHVLPYLLALCISGTLFGILLGLEHLIGEFGRQGRWRINVDKLVFLGLPPFLLYLLNILFYSRVISFGSFFMNHLVAAASSTPFITLSGVVLGYALITSVTKTEETA